MILSDSSPVFCFLDFRYINLLPDSLENFRFKDEDDYDNEI